MSDKHSPSMVDEASTVDEAIKKAIDDAIRQHELRVAFWSGLMGAVLLAGTWHAILLCR
jgi:hypothetical protein